MPMLQAMQSTSRFLTNGCYVHEHETDVYRFRKRPKSKKIQLEEQIQHLRQQMVQVVQSEQSFTSELVVQLSMKLDELINEYNKLAEEKKAE